MFYYVEGKVAHIEPYLAVIDCGGVGYACKTTNNTLSKLKRGQVQKLYTYLNVGEDIFELFGFATESELGSFKQLISVSGVGPKAALAILSATTPESLAMAIVGGNEKALTAAPGIGKKLAQRIILELKDKIVSLGIAQELHATPGTPAATNVNGEIRDEAVAALTALGFSPAPSAKVVTEILSANPDTPVEQVIKQALKMIK